MALIGVVLVDTLLGASVIFGSGDENELALYGSIVITAILSCLAVYAYQIDRWLNVHPIIAGLLLMFCWFSAIAVVELCAVYDSDFSLWRNVLFVFTGHH